MIIVSFIKIMLNHKKTYLKAVQVDLESFSGHGERLPTSIFHQYISKYFAK